VVFDVVHVPQGAYDLFGEGVRAERREVDAVEAKGRAA
jgi:hypothetical protein